MKYKKIIQLRKIYIENMQDLEKMKNLLMKIIKNMRKQSEIYNNILI